MQKEKNKCEECGSEIELDGYGCQKCCDHEPDPDEGYHCLQCGKDCYEDVAAAAYDSYKDRMKYGDD